MSVKDARAFMDAVAGIGGRELEPAGRGATTAPGGSAPPSSTKLGTIDTGWNGSGNPRVLFDGEGLMGLKAYPWAGMKPKAGDRVVLIPVGNSYVIAGTVGHTPPIGPDPQGRIAVTPQDTSWNVGSQFSFDGLATERIGNEIHLQGVMTRSGIIDVNYVGANVTAAHRPATRKVLVYWISGNQSPRECRVDPNGNISWGSVGSQIPAGAVLGFNCRWPAVG